MYPTVSQYAIALEELAFGKSRAEQKDILEHFIGYVHREREQAKLPLILKQLSLLADEKAGIVRVTAVTAHEVSGDAALQKTIRSGAEALFPGKKIELTFEQDEEVIGGVALRTDEMLYDGTLRAELEHFKKEIRE